MIIQPTKHIISVPIIRKVRNVVAAAPAVVSSGFETVPEEVEAERLLKCVNECPEKRWNPEGNFGLGECTHPTCGCTKLKLKFAAMQCPLGIWKVYHGKSVSNHGV